MSGIVAHGDNIVLVRLKAHAVVPCRASVLRAHGEHAPDEANVACDDVVGADASDLA